MATSALIGYTGFVGGNLVTQHRFDALFNSKNAAEIGTQEFDLLVVSAMPATMWIANRNPAEDRAMLDRLVNCLRHARAGQVVIMSTVAVYPNPIGVDEESSIDELAQLPYGRHRLLLERELSNHFPRVLSVRLPGLFGPGLKKNALYDLLHGNDLGKLNAAGVYQFYNLDRLWADVSIALASGLRVVNFATEPVTLRSVAREAFDLDFTNDPGTPPARFDMQSRRSDLFGGRKGYLYNREQVLKDLREFVQRERAAGRTL